MQANELAEQAIEQGDEPFSALLVVNNQIVAKANNEVIRLQDPTKHAEIEVIKKGLNIIKSVGTNNITLYSSTEPCPMCAGAIYWCGIKRVVFGCSIEKFSEICDAGLVVPCRSILCNRRKSIDVIGPILEKESANIHNLYKEIMVENV